MHLPSRLDPRFASALLCLTWLGAVSCSTDSSPVAPRQAVAPGALALSEKAESKSDNDDADDDDVGPHYNLDVKLHHVVPGRGSGWLAFRQPQDNDLVVFLYVSVKHLAPGATYRFQRAADAADGVCPTTGWLTLGTLTAKELPFTTDERGNAFVALSRRLGDASEGMTFDITFRVIDASGATVLRSGCYQYTARR
jgi:hypothetical protein